MIAATPENPNDGSGGYAAAIGSNEYEDLNGSITISGDLTVDAYSGEDAAATGSGDYGHMNGDITITGNVDLTAESGDDGAAIGSGDYGLFSGNLSIHNSIVEISTYGDDGTSLGAGYDGDFTGNISITGNSEIHATNSNWYVLIGAATGAPEGSVYIGKDVKVFDYYLSDTTPLSPEELPDAIGGILTLESAVVDQFWIEVYKDVMDAQKGDEIKVDAKWRTWIPRYVLEAVIEKEVTLVITWDGGEDVTIDVNTTFDEKLTGIKLADLLK